MCVCVRVHVHRRPKFDVASVPPNSVNSLRLARCAHDIAPAVSPPTLSPIYDATLPNRQRAHARVRTTTTTTVIIGISKASPKPPSLLPPNSPALVSSAKHSITKHLRMGARTRFSARAALYYLLKVFAETWSIPTPIASWPHIIKKMHGHAPE